MRPSPTVVLRRPRTSLTHDIFTGRVQFQPEIAVDPVTGTVVLSWRDGRDDAARARVATYLTTSIDGGQTFSAQTYANPSYTAINAITGQTVVIGPAVGQRVGGQQQHGRLLLAMAPRWGWPSSTVRSTRSGPET